MDQDEVLEKLTDRRERNVHSLLSEDSMVPALEDTDDGRGWKYVDFEGTRELSSDELAMYHAGKFEAYEHAICLVSDLISSSE